MFSSEEKMIQASINNLVNCFELSKSAQLIREAKGLFGIPDVLIAEDKIIAVEYKLSSWKRAMEQAYRYRSFSHFAYAIFDSHFETRIMKNCDEFQMFNIGLGFVDESGDLSIAYHPKYQEPYNDSLYSKALSLVGVGKE